MGEKLYIMSKDYIKDVGDDDDLIVFLNELSKEVRRLKKYCNSYKVEHAVDAACESRNFLEH